MKLSTRGRYAVMAMVDLANHSKEGPVSLATIGDRQEISVTYLEQLFLKLRTAGLVNSVRGTKGGYSLGRMPSEITVAHIVSAVEEGMKATRCVANSLKGCMRDRSQCLVHELWEGLENQISLFLDSVTIEDVLQKRVSGKNQVFK